MPQTPQVRTPFGGMNQDDSLVTPAKDTAGRNMFEVGDYRYALNARIGSSRDDSFGDLENIRDTVEVTNYFSNTSVIQNGDFQSGGLNFWDQTSDPAYVDWFYSTQGAKATVIPSSGGGVGPAPTFFMKGTVSGTTTASVAPLYPAGIQQGDLIFMMAMSRQPGVVAGAIAIPAGFSLVKSAYFRDNTLVGLPGIGILVSKVATGLETGSVNVTRNGPTGGNNTFIGQIYVYRGITPIIESSEFNVVNHLGVPSDVTFPALTVGGIHRTLLAFTAQPAITFIDNPSGYATTATDVVNSGTIHSSMKLCTKEDVSSDGAVTSTGGDTTYGWICFHVSIYDPTTGPTPTPFITEAIYQTIGIPIASQQLPFSFAVNASATVSSGVVKVVYMSGSTIVSEQTVYNGAITTYTFADVINVPAGVDGIGVRVSGTATVPTNVYIPYVNLVAKTQGGKPSGDERVIGKYQDDEFLKVWYCVWNSEGNHCIRYFDKKTVAVYEVLRWSGLNWQSTDFIKMAKLDNWIAFTGDKRNRPRLIDTDTITALSLTLGSEFREFHISHHKWAPGNPPIPRIYFDGTTDNYEKLKNKVFQFSYRYIYKGRLKSRWSPISKGATTCFLSNTYYATNKITSIELDIPGCIFDDPSDSGTAFNFFDHTDIKFTTAVESIEIAFKDGEFELWKLWKRIPVNSLFNRFHYFDGTGNLTPLDNDFPIPFDTVPFIAGTVEAIDNRFVFGDCLDELSPAQNVSATELGIKDNGQFEDNYWGDARAATGYTGITNAIARERLLRLNAAARQTFKDRGLYKMGVQFFDRTGWRSGAYTDDDWTFEPRDIAGFASGQSALSFEFKLPASFIPPEWAVGYQIMRTNALNMDSFMYGLVNNFAPIIDDVANFLDQMNLPEDVKKRIQDRFRDTFNVSGDEVQSEVTKELDAMQKKIDENQGKDKRKRFWNTVLKVNEIIGYGSTSPGFSHFNRNLKKWFTRNPIGPQLQQQLRMTKRIDALADASRIAIDINNWYFGAQDSLTKEFPLNNLIYNYRPGDRIRFTGSAIASPTNDDLREYDVPIIEFTGQTIVIEKPAGLQWISRYNQAGVQNFTVEVYSPMTATAIDHIFYEMGEWYPILHAGQSNRDFAKRDFTWSGQAAVQLNQYGPFDVYNKMPVYFGDSYLVPKTMYRSRIFFLDGASRTGSTDTEGLIFNSMVPDVNRTFDAWDRCNGRPAPSYQDLPVVKFKPTQVRYSGRIVEESFVNSLNQFEDPWQFIYPSEYGRIRDLVNTSNAQVESVGSILLAIGEREAWSIYVNRQTLEDLSGRTQVSSSDAVLGSYNTLLGSHGTLNPESVSRQRGRVYYWDAIDGSWIRYGRDGLTEISEYKMRNWFKDLGDLLIDQYLTSDRPWVLSEMDPFNDELITRNYHSSLPATFRGYDHYKGSLFSENDKRWKSCHTWDPEMMAKISNQVISFKDGNVILHEKGNDFSTFYGVKQDVMWEPVFNDEPSLKKVWLAFAETVTDPWSVQRILSEYRGLKTKQQTLMPINLFTMKEDNWYAEIRKDITTPKANPSIEGNVMRSKAIQVLMKLKTDVVHRSLLHYVTAIAADSPKND